LPIVGSGGAGEQQHVQKQAQTQALTTEEQKAKRLSKKKRTIALKKQQLELEAAEMELED
jgi:hypothetical protein